MVLNTPGGSQAGERGEGEGRWGGGGGAVVSCLHCASVSRSGQMPDSDTTDVSVVRAATLKHTLQIQLGRPPSRITLTPYQAPGVTGSALGLVGVVSTYRDWVR